MTENEQPPNSLRISLCMAEIARLNAEVREYGERCLAGDESAFSGYYAASYYRNQYKAELEALVAANRRTTARQSWDVLSVRPNGHPGVREDHLLLTLRRGGTFTTMALISE